MHRLTRIAAACSILAVAAVTVGIHDVSAARRVVGHVYVNDNTAGTNTIGAFDRLNNGALLAMAGSPFPTGGAGTGQSIGSQGALQVSSDGRYLLAVDAGSNQISVLRIRSDGELTAVDGSPVSSGGITPVSIAVHGNLVYVANVGNGVTGANYTGFRLNPAGHLVPLRHSTIPLSKTANPGDIFFSPDGTHLVGTEVGTTDPSTWRIDSFVVRRDGRLTPAPGSPFAAQGPGPFGSEFRPTNATQLFVSNAHGGTDNGTVSAFRVARNGALASIGASPFPDAQTAPCWIEITRDGRYLFAVNTASASISRYVIAADGSLTLLGSTAMKRPDGLSPFDARLSPGGRFLYVVDSGRDAVSAFAVSGADLTEVPSSPTAGPTGAAPFGIVVL